MKCVILVVLVVLFEITGGWEQGVKECRDGVEPVLKGFPEPTHRAGETIWSSFSKQTDNLQDLTNSDSTILSTNAVAILETLAKLSKAGKNPITILSELQKHYPDKTDCYRSVTTSLRKYIGFLQTKINNSVLGVGIAILDVLDAFDNRKYYEKQNRCANIDFKSLVKAIRLNSNIVAFIGAESLKDRYSRETYESITIISLVSNLLLLSTHGTNANIGTVLHDEGTDLSPTLSECFEALDPIVTDTTNLISGASFDSEAGLKNYLRNYSKIIVSYNTSLEKLLGKFEGVGFNAAYVKRNLKK